MNIDERRYWNELADRYQQETQISCEDFHYAPLLPGDAHFQLLPPVLSGLRCLELGCGAGQNSIFLASRGAECSAVDVSERQLRLGSKTAAEQDLDICWIQADMDELPLAPPTSFDLIHCNSLGFCRGPAALVAHCARLLSSGGQFIAATHHTAFAGEWLEVDEGEEGMFLSDYRHPPPDLRASETSSGTAACCRSYPPSEVHAWFTAAKLIVDVLLEPVAPPLREEPSDSPAIKRPYDSPEWRTYLPMLERFPFISIVRGFKPAQPGR